MHIGRKENKKKTVVITAVVVGSDSISSANSSSNCNSRCPGVTVMSEVKVLKVQSYANDRLRVSKLRILL